MLQKELRNFILIYTRFLLLFVVLVVVVVLFFDHQQIDTTRYYVCVYILLLTKFLTLSIKQLELCKNREIL